MKRALLASLLSALFALAACGGPAENSRKSDEPTPITKVPPQDEEEVDGDGKKWRGWRYKGARDDCFFLYKGRCYTSERKACKAAGCKGKDCKLEGAGPATVSCKKKEEMKTARRASDGELQEEEMKTARRASDGPWFVLCGVR